MTGATASTNRTWQPEGPWVVTEKVQEWQAIWDELIPLMYVVEANSGNWDSVGLDAPVLWAPSGESFVAQDLGFWKQALQDFQVAADVNLHAQADEGMAAHHAAVVPTGPVSNIQKAAHHAAVVPTGPVSNIQKAPEVMQDGCVYFKLAHLDLIDAKTGVQVGTGVC